MRNRGYRTALVVSIVFYKKLEARRQAWERGEPELAPPLVEEDRAGMGQLLTFFETVCILIQRDVLDPVLMDDLFRYRFFLAVDDEEVRRMEISPDVAFSRNLYRLEVGWDRLARQRDPGYERIARPLREFDDRHVAAGRGRRGALPWSR